MASRVVGWEASPNFETSVAAFAANGRTTDCLARIKRWLSLDRDGRVPASIKPALVAIDTDYELEGGEGAGQTYIRPGRLSAPRVADPQDQKSCKWDLPPPAFGSGAKKTVLAPLCGDDGPFAKTGSGHM
jgi:hypothetical protein